MKTASLVVTAFALCATNAALAFEPAKAPVKLSDLTPKYTPVLDNGPGKMPSPPRPAPPSYPAVKQAPNGDPRLYINKDVSVGGSLQPLSGNVQFPLPESKKGR